MSSGPADDRIRFRAREEKEAAEFLDEIHLGGINRSQLARDGLTLMLQRIATDEDKKRVCEEYQNGDLSEHVAEIILGDDLAPLQADSDACPDTTDGDTNQSLA